MRKAFSNFILLVFVLLAFTLNAQAQSDNISIDVSGKKIVNVLNEISDKSGVMFSYESVVDAITFGAKRIGHGIRSIESEVVMSKLEREKIVLEICPTSNINTKAVLSMEIHPIKELINKGVLVTINTDNRTVSNTTLNREYELLREAFNFSDEDFIRFNLNAISCAFISEEEKMKLRRLLIIGR